MWPFLYPDSEWDFRLEQVRSINASGHKYGLVYPGIGWLVFRETSDLAEDLVFYENYLGKTDATFTLNFSTGSAMVLAQYYNFVRFGHEGYRYIMETMQANARSLAKRIGEIGEFELIGDEGAEQLPLVAFQLAGDHNYDEFDVASQLAAERGWMVPAYTLPPNARARDDHARAGQADAEPHAGEHARRRHRPGLRDAGARRAACTSSTASASRPAPATELARRPEPPEVGVVEARLRHVPARAAAGGLLPTLIGVSVGHDQDGQARAPAVSALHTAKPSSSPSRTSRSTASGSWRSTAAKAHAAQSASPTTSYPRAARRRRAASLNVCWSSTITTRWGRSTTVILPCPSPFVSPRPHTSDRNSE